MSDSPFRNFPIQFFDTMFELGLCEKTTPPKMDPCEPWINFCNKLQVYHYLGEIYFIDTSHLILDCSVELTKLLDK